MDRIFPGLVVSTLVRPFQPRHSTAVVTVIDQDWKNFRGKSNFSFSGLADTGPGTSFNGSRQDFFSAELNYFRWQPA
jgi:hypothetical protein